MSRTDSAGVVAAGTASGRRRVLDTVASLPAWAAVLLVWTGGRVLSTLDGLGYRGAVIEGFGGGHVAERTVDAVRALAAQMPVVLASRTGAGATLTTTYGFAGGEIDLLGAGLVPAGTLDGLKARLLLAALLALDAPDDRIHAAFAAHGRGSPPTGHP